MLKYEKSSALYDHLMELATRVTRSDLIFDEGCDEWDFDCGNENDAYNSGTEDGETQLAREILREFFDTEVGSKDDN